jgi:hypothetical protein
MYAKSVPDSMRIEDQGWVKPVTENIKDAGGTNRATYRYFSKQNYNKVQPIDVNDRKKDNGAAYKYKNDWERLAFSWAIHKGDSLYVLKGAPALYNNNVINDPADLWMQLTIDYGVPGESIDFGKLISENIVGNPYYELYYPRGDKSVGGDQRRYYNYKTMPEVERTGNKIGLQAIIALDDNTHKDWVFSFRYIERRSDDFVIESETTERNTTNGPVIRPGYAGWVKSDNGVPVITRSDTKKLMSEAAIFNVNRPEDRKDPVGNEEVTTSAMTVIGGTGNVTILNATGKNVVISNLLGQTIANAKITSDKAAFAVPAGIVIVAVEGENAVKALVK